jgi:hypothetical protein
MVNLRERFFFLEFILMHFFFFRCCEMLQCITLGSASSEGGDELEDGINLNVTARVSLIE